MISWGPHIDPAREADLEQLLRRHKITLRRRFGQNFLIDPALRDEIAAAAGATGDDDVLEVGAGVGTLTIALASLARRVIAVELDRDLIPALREVIAGLDNVEVVQADILRYERHAEIVTGNIPYNLTGALIPKLLDQPPRPRRLSLVIQKEVAERWTASTMASLATVAVQVFAVPRLLMTIPAAAFFPPPRVDSALVVLEVRERPAVDVEDMPAFLRFVEAVFQFRRKQLGGILNRIGFTLGDDFQIDLTRRPQTLTLGEWEALYRALKPGPRR